MRVGFFEHTGCIITMLPNDVQGYKIKPQGIPIGSFTVPKVAENTEANSEEDEDIDTMDEESAALDEEFRIINDEGGNEFDMDDEEHNYKMGLPFTINLMTYNMINMI